MVLVDVKRCRKNALLSGYRMPVFCVLDDIQPFFSMDADFFYISECNDDILFTGARWYHRCVIDRLEASNCKYEVTHSLTASGHLKSDAFNEPFSMIESAWSNCQNNLAKQAINAAIGLMGSRENYAFQSILSTDENDSNLLSGHVVHNKINDIHEYISRTHLKEVWSVIPIYFFCLDYERCMVARIRDFSPMNVIEYRTDSVLIQDTKIQRSFPK